MSDPQLEFSGERGDGRKGTPPVRVAAFASRAGKRKNDRYRHRPRSYSELGDSGTSEPKALVLVIGSDWLGGSFAAFAIVDEPPTAFLALADHGVVSDNLRTLTPSPILVDRIVRGNRLPIFLYPSP